MKLLECKNGKLFLMIPEEYEIKHVGIRLVKSSGKELIFNQADSEFKETTRYEITERKPDYAAMVKRRQYGKFLYDNTIVMGYLTGQSGEYFSASITKGERPIMNFVSTEFTPCSEPVELNDITMEPKDPGDRCD